MAKFIEKVGRVTVELAEPDDDIYQQGWTITTGVIWGKREDHKQPASDRPTEHEDRSQK